MRTAPRLESKVGSGEDSAQARKQSGSLVRKAPKLESKVGSGEDSAQARKQSGCLARTTLRL